MARHYKPKINRKASSPSKVLAGIKLIKQGWSIRQAASKVKVQRTTLFNYAKRVENGLPASAVKPSFQSRNVFPEAMENDIADYCLQVATMGYGLTTQTARDLAYEVAIKNNLKVPPSWNIKKTAGIDWFHGKLQSCFS